MNKQLKEILEELDADSELNEIDMTMVTLYVAKKCIKKAFKLGQLDKKYGNKNIRKT